MNKMFFNTNTSEQRETDSPPGKYPRKQRKGGFTLIEVNMALMVVAIGLLSLLTLFPEGLRLSAYARADMRNSFFCDMIFGMVKGNASDISDPDKWKVANLLKNTGGISPSPSALQYYDIEEMHPISKPSLAKVLEDPTRYMIFNLRILPHHDIPHLFTVALYCSQNFSTDPVSALSRESGFYTAVHL